MKKIFVAFFILVVVLVNVIVVNPFNMKAGNNHFANLFLLQHVLAQYSSGDSGSGDNAKYEYADDRVRDCIEDILCICIDYRGMPYKKECYKRFYQYKIECIGTGHVSCVPYEAPKHYYFDNCTRLEIDCSCAIASTH